MTNPPSLADRMAAHISAWEAARDGRAVFLSCYALMTGNMLRAVEQGRFHDNRWVGELVHHFAEYYFVALEAYERSGTPPEVWRLAHRLARAETTTVVQSLMMGINAHINYDLVLALADMLQPEWGALPPERRLQRYQDHCAVNVVIGETIDAVQDRVVEPQARAMMIADALCGPLDEWCTARLIRNWREDVWRYAVAIVEAPDEHERARLCGELDGLALRRIRLLTEGGEAGARVFGYPLRWLRRLRIV